MRLQSWTAVPAFVCLVQSNAVAQSISLSFEEALGRAREQAPAVLIARARVEEARGRLSGAQVRFRENPTLDFGMGPRRTELGTLTDFDIGFGQLFETGGQRAARIAAAEAGTVRETAAADETRRLALRTVAMAYVRTVYAQERIEVLRGSETIARQVLSVAERRNAAGDIAVLDVNIAKVALGRARAARLAAEGDRTVVAGELQRLLGIPPSRSVLASGSLRQLRRPDLQTLLSSVANRPDLRAMEADIRAAQADVRLGQAAGRADLGLGARYKHEEGHDALIGQLTLTLPTSNKGQELRATGAARASRVRLELDTTRASIESEVRSLYQVLATREAALDAFEQDAMPGIDANDALARRSFEVGQISLPDLLLVRRELVEAQLEHLSRQLEVAEAAIEQDATAGLLR